MHTGKAIPNNQKVCEITEAELPLYCPQANMSLWNSHPRVFLPIAQAAPGKVRCPYCGTEYLLIRHAMTPQKAA